MRSPNRGVFAGFVRSFIRSRRSALCGLAALALSPSASAHYGIPFAYGIIFGPAGTDHVIVRSDIWGFMRSWDNGATWQWSCAEVYGGSSANAEYHPMLVTSSGRILVTGTFEGLRLSDNFCDWRKSDAFGSAQVADIAPWGNDLIALTSTSGDGGAFTTVLWKSTNQGDAWTTTGTAMPAHLIGESVRAAPSDAKRVYVAGIAPNGTVGLLQRSTDGGATWTEHEFAFDAQKQPIAQFRMPLVHATRPDVAFIRVDMPEGLGMDAPDSILGTKDGGLTWTKVFDSIGDLPGIAVSPDGKTLLVAGPKDGLNSADVDDALTRGQAAFQQVWSGRTFGLNWVDDGTANGLLYAGNDNFGAVGVPEVMLGKSHDGGHTFDLVMNICQISYPESCAASTTVDTQCQRLWSDKQQNLGFGLDFVYGSRCVKDAGPDAGNNAAAKASSSCACSAPGRSGNGTPLAAALAALAVAAGRLRRKSKSVR